MTDTASQYDSLPTSGPEPTRQQYQEGPVQRLPQAERRRRFLMGVNQQDAQLGDAVTRIMATAPWSRRAPGWVMDLANDAVRRGDVNGVLVDIQDADSFLRVRQHYHELTSTAETTQQQVWDTMGAGAQQALRHQGYMPPGERAQQPKVQEEGFGSAIGSVLHTVGHALAAPGDWNPGHFGPSVNDIIHDVGTDAWRGVQEISKVPTHLYRAGHLLNPGGDLGHASLGGFVDDLRDPGHVYRAWKDSYDGERMYDPKVTAEVGEMFEDKAALETVKRLAAGESIYDVASSLADPGSKNWGTAVGSVDKFASNPTVVEAVQKLQNAKVSPGRDLARGVGLKPGSNEFALLSGLGDAAFQWFTDPTLLAGRARMAMMEARFGISLVDGEDVASRVRSFYGSELDARAALRDVRDVTAPGYEASLAGAQLSPHERAVTMISDHVTQASDVPEAWGLLAQRMPRIERLIEGDGGLKVAGKLATPTDVVDYFADGANLSALMQGRLAHYRYQFATLPRLTRAGTRTMQGKLAFEDAIDFMSDYAAKLHSPILDSEVAAGNLSAVQRGIGHGTSIILAPVARAFQQLSDLIPTQGFLPLLDDPDRGQQFDRLLSIGVHGPERRELYGKLINTTTESGSRAVVQSALKTVFANLGLLDSPDTRGFVSKWLNTIDQRYALDDLDLNPAGGHSGMWLTDRASAVAIPRYAEVMAEVKRVRLEQLLTGFGGEDFAARALRRWEPVQGGLDTANRMWRTAALVAPAFAMRVGLEEALNQYSRLGPQHNLRAWLLMPMDAADPGAAFLSKVVKNEDPGIVHRALSKVSNPVFGVLPDSVRWSARSQAEKMALTAEAWYQKATGGLLPEGWRKAFRERAFVDAVARGYEEVGGHRIGMQGVVAPPVEREAFITLPAATMGVAHDVEFDRVPGQFAETQVTGQGAHVAGRFLAAGQLQHVAADPAVRARLSIRSMFLDEAQARQIAAQLGIEGDPFDKVKEVRQAFGALQPSDRARLVAWADRDPQGALRQLGLRVRDQTLPVPGGRGLEAENALKHGGTVTIGSPERAHRELAGILFRVSTDPRASDPAKAVELVKEAVAAAGERVPRLDEALATVPELDQLAAGKFGWLTDPIAASARMRTVRRGSRTAEILNPLHEQLPVWLGRLDDLDANARHALLAHPGTAFGDLPVEHGWTDLLDRVQRGDVAAWHQLENEVDVAALRRWHGNEIGAPGQLDAFDRVGPLFGVDDENLSKIDALHNWAEDRFTGLTQLTSTPDGKVIHGLTVPMSTDTLDPIRHVVDAPSELPHFTVAPAVQLAKGETVPERMVNGFFDWAEGIINDISRTPIWHGTYARVWEETDRAMRPLLTDPSRTAAASKAVVGDLSHASDRLLEIDHRLEEAWRSLPPGERGQAMQSVADLTDSHLREVLAAHGVKLRPDADLGAIRSWWRTEANARDEIASIAAARSRTEITPFIHDPRLRSQFAEAHRWAFPFLFAQEQFYKRWGRTALQSPESIARLSLLNHAMHSAGFLDTDAEGRPVFVYPGSAWSIKAITHALDLLPGQHWSVPVSAPLTGQLGTAIPGLEEIDSLPSAGPGVALPLHILTRFFPDIGKPLEHVALGQMGEGRDLVSTVVPARWKRLYDVIAPDARADSVIAAMQVAEANDAAYFRKTGKHLVPQDGADDLERQVWMDRLNNHARIMALVRGIFGLVGPASPHPDLKPTDLNAKLQLLLGSGMPVADAFGQFLAEDPDATAWTVFPTMSPSGAPTSPSAAAYDTMTAHPQFFDRYKQAAAWFLPEHPPGTDQPFDPRAWREMLAHEVRVRKGADVMWEDLKFAEAAPQFFGMADSVTEALTKAPSASMRQVIRDTWSEEQALFFATHPVFAKQYLAGGGEGKRREAMREMRSALTDPDLPTVPQTESIRSLIGAYDITADALAQLRSQRSGAGAARRKAVRESFDQWATAFTETHPTANAFYLRIIRPDLKLPAVVDQGN